MRLKTIAPVAAAAILLAACGNGVRENVKKLNDAEESLRLNPHNAEALAFILEKLHDPQDHQDQRRRRTADPRRRKRWSDRKGC